MLKNAAINAEFDYINRRSLQLFYTLDMDDVYYNKELDCFVVMNIQDGVLYLDSFISTQSILLQDVLERVDVKVVLGFTPKDNTERFRAEPFDGEDDYRFFYIGEQPECVSREHLFFRSCLMHKCEPPASLSGGSFMIFKEKGSSLEVV